MPSNMKPRSHEVTDGFERAPARAMLRAVGMTDDDWGKPQVGVASSWNEVTPCNLPLDRLARRAKEGVHGSWSGRCAVSACGRTGPGSCSCSGSSACQRLVRLSPCCSAEG